MSLGKRSTLVALALAASTLTAPAQQATKPAYLDPSLPAEARAADLVKRLTPEEKVQQMPNQARAITRLGIPAYDWWSEALHGVSLDGTTEFPEPIGLGATFDTALIKRMARAIAIEGRVTNARAYRARGGNTSIMEGLDFWAPNINIFRDPRWGRGQETYGEDPFLTGHLGIAFVNGMQGNDPRYYLAIATPKHLAVHSGPESTRHKADVEVSKHDMVDTYLPAFRATVVDGHADSVMCAYNSVNGQPACLNDFLLVDQLRNKWNFKGYVVSDCGAVIDAFEGHHYKPTQSEVSALALKAGVDSECVDWLARITDDHDYKPYADALKQGLISEADLDRALVRQFKARIELGFFAPQEMVAYNKIDPAELDSATHRALAREVADKSMVLLKNDGTLPLKAPKSIAVIGPLAEQEAWLNGNYQGVPSKSVSILDGLKKQFPSAKITFVPGTFFLNKEVSNVPDNLLSVDGKPGVKATYYKLDLLSHADGLASAPVLSTRIESNINTKTIPLPAEAKTSQPLSMRWEATITPDDSGEYSMGVEGDGYLRFFFDGKILADNGNTHGVETKLSTVQLEKGVPHQIAINYGLSDRTTPNVRLVWMKHTPAPEAAAVEAARKADVTVAVVGITSELEGEEMRVTEEGFFGGDRTTLDLPKPEQKLLEAVATTGKPLVVVLANGSALSVNWADKHANAILEAWYPGEEGGSAVADTLAGRSNPAGRLPVTFYKSVEQLPAFEDYAMKNRTYRYFTGTPLYPFGYGLSYTTFAYSKLTLSTSKLEAGQPLTASATLTNTGHRDGEEVAQLYLDFPQLEGAPRLALRGFERIALKAGESKTIHFTLTPRDLSMVTPAGDPQIAAGNYTLSIGGGQPHTTAPVVATNFTINGTVKLPE